MDLLLRILWEVVLTPSFLIFVVVVVVFLVVRRLIHTRNHNKARDEQIAALTPLAERFGGKVLGPGEAAMWTADLDPPLMGEVSGIFRVAQRSKRNFDLSVDFQRGPWHVRVTEASVRVDTRGFGVRIVQEHRIEIATARMAPMKTIRPDKYDPSGAPLSPQRIESMRKLFVSSPPSSVERGGSGWQPVPLPPPMDQEFSVYGADPAAAVREFNFDALHWLIDQEPSLPDYGAKLMCLTFEEGYVYMTKLGHIYPDQLMIVVDTICGLLDRMPGARPRHPAAAV